MAKRIGLLAFLIWASVCGVGCQSADPAQGSAAAPAAPPPPFSAAEADSVLSELDARAQSVLEFFAIVPLEVLRSQNHNLSVLLHRRHRLELTRWQDTTRFLSPSPNVLDYRHSDSLRLRLVIFEQHPQLVVVGIQADESPDSTGCGFTSAELLYYDYHTWMRVSGDAFPQPLFTEAYLPPHADRTACGHTLLHHGDVLRRFASAEACELFLPCQYQAGSPAELPRGVLGEVKTFRYNTQNHGFGITWP